MDLTGLKQNSSPNKTQTLFISGKYIGILVELVYKTERFGMPITYYPLPIPLNLLLLFL